MPSEAVGIQRLAKQPHVPCHAVPNWTLVLETKTPIVKDSFFWKGRRQRPFDCCFFAVRRDYLAPQLVQLFEIRVAACQAISVVNEPLGFCKACSMSKIVALWGPPWPPWMRRSRPRPRLDFREAFKVRTTCTLPDHLI